MKARSLWIFIVPIIVLVTSACGTSQDQPAPATEASIPMSQSTIGPIELDAGVVETMDDLELLEIDPGTDDFFCAENSTCRNFQNPALGLQVIFNIDNGVFAILRTLDNSGDYQAQLAAVTTILEAYGLSETEIEWVSAHAEGALAGNVEIGNFPDHTITEVMSFYTLDIKEIMIKIEPIR